MKKIFIPVLVIFSLITQTVFAQSCGCASAAAAKRYPDVDENHPNYEAIEYLSEAGVIGGYPDGTFGPDKEINRAELMKMVILMQEVFVDDQADHNFCFPDVNDQWFAYHVCVGKELGWIDGYPDGNFLPVNPTNRAEAIKIILNAFYKGEIPELSDGEKIAVMPEEYDETQWYADYVKFAFAQNKLDLSHVTFPGDTIVFNYDLGGNITRKEVAEMIYRLLEYKSQPLYEVELKIESGSSYDYYLIGPDGEEALNAVAAAISSSSLFLAVLDYEGKLIVENLMNGDVLYEVQLPDDIEGTSQISGSLDDRFITIVTVKQEDYPETTKYYVIDLIEKTHEVFDEKIVFTCGASCYPEELMWAAEDYEFIALTYPGENQYENEYEFKILDPDGDVDQVYDIPDDGYDSWPIIFGYSFDKSQIIYYYELGGEKYVIDL